MPANTVIDQQHLHTVINHVIFQEQRSFLDESYFFWLSTSEEEIEIPPFNRILISGNLTEKV